MNTINEISKWNVSEQDSEKIQLMTDNIKASILTGITISKWNNISDQDIEKMQSFSDKFLME